MNKKSLPENIEFLFDASTIRMRCSTVFKDAEAGKLRHWVYRPNLLPTVSNFVLDVIREEYPKLDIPYHGRWRHINVGDIDRLSQVLPTGSTDKVAQARLLFESTLVSVLVDAGAGMAWQYLEKDTRHTYSKSEGLAVAAFHMQKNGYFSHYNQSHSYEVTGKGLTDLTLEKMQSGFQVSDSNPIVGLKGRANLLQSLGQLILRKSEGFEQGERLAELFDYIASDAQNQKISAKKILKSLLVCLGPIWPGRMVLDGFNLGDCWEHYALMGEERLPGLLPFHKLSQWLTYSLFEVFEHAGYEITDMDELTGLPEYRNGGLLIDMGVLAVKDPSLLKQSWRASDELIIEWRALTVILLDKIADLIRKDLSMTKDQLPLAKVLQGGTWLAGRRKAKEKRPDGGPPFPIVSDGTVF